MSPEALDEFAGWLSTHATPIEVPPPLDEPELERRVRRQRREVEQINEMKRGKT